MKKRIVFPAEESRGLDSKLSEHFGRAPFFIAVELDEDGSISEVVEKANRSEHFGGSGRPVDFVLQLKPDVVVTYEIGPGALSTLRSAGVLVLRAAGSTVREAIEAYKQGSLREVTEDYSHHHHHHFHHHHRH